MGTTLLLLLTAAIWGFAFVAQRVGMEHLGPFLFNGVRFALGALSLIPAYLLTRGRGRDPLYPTLMVDLTTALRGGCVAGILLFAGASLQQMGIQYTTAGKAGFITGLYVVMVPLLGALGGTRSTLFHWAGALSATAGLYLLSVTGGWEMERGDLLVLISALFFALHVLYLSRVSPRCEPITLSVLQYLVVSLCSLLTALFTEKLSVDAVFSAWLPILYGGIFSVGIAYSLQVLAQKKAHPTQAAILLSMEGLFAAVGGSLFLGEALSVKEAIGAALMVGGALVSQGYRS